MRSMDPKPKVKDYCIPVLPPGNEVQPRARLLGLGSTETRTWIQVGDVGVGPRKQKWESREDERKQEDSI